MADSCPTVQIDDPKAPGGYVVINEEDFNPEKHKLYQPKDAPASSKADDPKPATIDDAVAKATGKKKA